MFKFPLIAIMTTVALTSCAVTSEHQSASKNQQTTQTIQTPAATIVASATQSIQKYSLYDNDIAGSIYSAKVETNVSKSDTDEFIIDITTPELTAYFPKEKNVQNSAVIICPGGAYYGLSMIKEGEDIARRFNQLGITAFVLKYRMPSTETMTDKSTGPLQDVQQAFAFVRQHSNQWQLAEDKIGVMGFSAGGHLASSAAVHFNQPVLAENTPEMIKPNFQILVYPVISMADSITHKGSRTNLLGENYSAAQLTYYSNETQVSTDSPKAFIVHANDDKAVPVENSLHYYQALNQQHVATQLLLLPSGGHGFGMRHPFDWFNSLTMWLENNQLL